MIADPKRKPHQDDVGSESKRQEEALDEALENRRLQQHFDIAST